MTDSHASKAHRIMQRVDNKGCIELETLVKLCRLLGQKTDYQFHCTVEILTGAILKTVDNEVDAQKTISNLEKKPDV